MHEFHGPRKLAVAAVLLLFASGAWAQGAPPGKAATPLQVEGNVTAPIKISGWYPVYPELARKAGVQGTVIVKSIIDEHGDVTETTVLQSLPLGLDQAALAAVKTWKFKPATLEGRPVKVYYSLNVNFTVKGGSATYGPLFRKFLEEHADFANFLVTRRFQDAAQLLDRWEAERPASSSEIVLARCYLLLDQDRVKEAWQTAQSYRGPDPFELPYIVGRWALAMALKPSSHKISNPAALGEIIELGLQAETQAMAVRKDPLPAVFYKSQLLSEKAKLASDPKTREALVAEAEQLLALARELYSKGVNPDPFASPAQRP